MGTMGRQWGQWGGTMGRQWGQAKNNLSQKSNNFIFTQAIIVYSF